jgi:signal peptidase
MGYQSKKTKADYIDRRKYNLKQIVSFIGNIMFAFVVILMVVLVFFLVQSNIRGQTPKIAGHQMYIVLSGSMYPEFNAGSIVLVKDVDTNKIEVGDIITYKDIENEDTLITHRVVEINIEENRSFVTKGDANAVIDPHAIPEDRVIGKVLFSLPYIGLLLDFVRTKKGLLIFVILPSALIIVFEIINLYRYATELDKEKQSK